MSDINVILYLDCVNVNKNKKQNKMQTFSNLGLGNVFKKKARAFY